MGGLLPYEMDDCGVNCTKCGVHLLCVYTVTKVSMVHTEHHAIARYRTLAKGIAEPTTPPTSTAGRRMLNK